MLGAQREEKVPVAVGIAYSVFAQNRHTRAIVRATSSIKFTHDDCFVACTDGMQDIRRGSSEFGSCYINPRFNPQTLGETGNRPMSLRTELPCHSRLLLSVDRGIARKEYHNSSVRGQDEGRLRPFWFSRRHCVRQRSAIFVLSEFRSFVESNRITHITSIRSYLTQIGKPREQ